ncbi:unnamed protein product [Paramecium octaurelia]|uniref:Protein kinase domain-containing protein n=1 Tax=Paramecium octaurelia TaxID=43137 RepID=A0A8S1VP22_PAROT|nr:unnamed protein product [Paramecium octaurelia]
MLIKGLKQFYLQTTYFPTIKLINNCVYFSAKREDNINEDFICQLDLADIAIQWSYCLSNNFLNGLKVYRQKFRFTIYGLQDELYQFQGYIKGKIPFTANLSEKYELDTNSMIETDTFLALNFKTQKRKLLKRLYNKQTASLDEFKIQVFLQKCRPQYILYYNSHYVRDKEQFISFDCDEFRTLKSILQHNPQGLPLQTIRIIMQQLITGLEFLHSNGIIHQDIRPENIIITNADDIQIKISNFNQAIFVEELAKFVGKRPYVDPQLITKFNTENKLDIFSAGLIFYALLIGKILEQPILISDAIITLQQLKVNDEAIDLFKEMVNIDKIERLSASECLNHNFFVDCPYQVQNLIDKLDQITIPFKLNRYKQR